MSPSSYTSSNMHGLRRKRIGKGGQASIYLHRNPTDGTMMVEKVFHASRTATLPANLRPRSPRQPSHTSTNTLQEIYRALGGTDLVVKVLKFPSTDEPNMFLEYCEGGDLHRLIEYYAGRGIPLPESFIWHVFASLVKILTLMHTGLRPPRSLPAPAAAPAPANTASRWLPRLTTTTTTPPTPQAWKPIIHRDIKPDNILLSLNAHNPSSYPLIKLSDFDLSTFHPHHTSDPPSTSATQPPPRPRPHRGLRGWAPPEQYCASTPYAMPEGDVWAVGAVVHALATGRAVMYYTGVQMEHWDPLPGQGVKKGGKKRGKNGRDGGDGGGGAVEKKKRLLPDRYSAKLEECVLMALNPVWSRASALQLREAVLPAQKEYLDAVGQEVLPGFPWLYHD